MNAPTGIAAPEPRVMVTILGLTVDHVRVVDARRTRSAPDMVRVELGEVHLTGDLHTMALVVARAAEGFAAIEAARQTVGGVEGCIREPEGPAT